MRMTGVFQIPRLNLAGYKRKLAESLTAALTQGAFEWLQAATVEIPVWSGASLATFLQLSRAIGFHLDISPKPNAPDRVSFGVSHSKGSFDSDVDAGRFSFTYETDLRWLIYNEFNNANISPDPGLFSRLLKPGPYQFQDKGREAFLRAMRGTTLPDARPFIKVKVKRVK